MSYFAVAIFVVVVFALGCYYWLSIRRSFRDRLCRCFCYSSTKLSRRLRACRRFDGRSELISFWNSLRKSLSSSSKTLRHSVLKFGGSGSLTWGCCLSFGISLSFSTGLLLDWDTCELSEFFLALLTGPLALTSLYLLNPTS